MIVYEIKQGMRDGIATFTREVVSANVLEVEAGTNGYKGGDSGHGSRTYFRIEDLASTDMTIGVTEHGFWVSLGGDCELETITEALRFIVQVLEEQAEEYGDSHGGR